MKEILDDNFKDVVVANKKIVPYKNWQQNKILFPADFDYQKTTVWSFPNRGNWATHTPQYRGNWSPNVVRNILHLYSKPNDLVLDCMVGGGTTPVECKLMGRNSISVDINPDSIYITRERLHIPGFDDSINKTIHKTFVGDVRDLDKIDDESVDLIATHPPYANMIRYTDLKYDLSTINSYKEFFSQYKKAIDEMYRVLKPGSFCAIMIGDTHNKSFYVPLSNKMMMDYLAAGFVLKEDIIKREWNCTSEGRTYPGNFLLTAHEHIYVFMKPRSNDNSYINSSIRLFD